VPDPTLVIVGAGPGLGSAVAHRFGTAGYDVGLVARSEQRLADLADGLRAAGVGAGWVAADITDPGELTAAIRRFGDRSGRIGVLHVNPSAYREADPLHLSPDELLEDLRVGVAPLLTCVQAVRPYLVPGSRITATGSVAADRPSPGVASLGVQKAAMRNLVTSIDGALASRGVRAASLTVRGVLAAGTPFAPARVADALFDMASRSDEHWTTEVPFDG
jgi:NAD(P)-dependent dehydrogenase (short-subunit alcohol dehydrogenase family)